jgi:hypothetical protein
MDHPCYKCGHSIEDGKPFCPQCGSPQIRVTMPEPAAQSVEGNVSSIEASPFSLGSTAVANALNVPTSSTGIRWPRALRVCAVAALISVVVMSLRLLVPLLAVFGAGCLTVILYRSRNPIWKANARTGAQLGAVTALFSSGVVAIFSAIVFAALQAGGQFRQQLLDSLQQAVARSNDPQMQAGLDFLKQPEGLAAKLILAMAGFVLVSVAAGSIAGALTGAFMGRRKRQ